MLSVCTMLSLSFWAQALLAVAPFTAGFVVRSGPAKELPLLLDATAEELSSGLDSGAFTSVDLVNVRCRNQGPSSSVLTWTGLCQAYSRSQRHTSYSHRAQPGCLDYCERVGRRASMRETSRVSVKNFDCCCTSTDHRQSPARFAYSHQEQHRHC